MAQPRVLLQLAAIDKTAQRGKLGWLTGVERTRLDGMRSAARRESFLAGHWLARRLAADWLGLGLTQVVLDAFADGRPALRVKGEPVPLSLSIAHSGDWLAVALGEVAVGVDLELPRRGRDLDALARFAFSADEARALGAMEEPAREAEFLNLWSLKEACVKRSGEGLRPRQARSLRAQACEAADSQARSWDFHGGAIALAAGCDARIEFAGWKAGAARCWRYLRETG